MIIAIIGGICTGNIADVSNAVFSGAQNAIELCLTLVGMMMLWCGIMKIAERAGLTTVMGRICSPLIRIFFPGLDPHSEASYCISMNIAANFLGLGNAATPFGLKAMAALKKEGGLSNTASNHMITFVVLNTASIQLIPSTIAAMRAKYGAVSPMDIMPAVWISSCLALMVGMIINAICCSFRKKVIQ